MRARSIPQGSGRLCIRIALVAWIRAIQSLSLHVGVCRMQRDLLQQLCRCCSALALSSHLRLRQSVEWRVGCPDFTL